MKKITLILSFLFFFYALQLHSQTSTFVKKYKTLEASSNTTSIIHRTTQNKKILTTGGIFCLIAEIDEQGDTVKTSSVIPLNGGIGGTVIDDAGNNIWLNSTRFNASPTFYWQSALTKLDNNYNPLFSKVYSSPTGHLNLSAVPLLDTTFIIKGIASHGGWNNPFDMVLIKTNKNGDTLWCKKYNDGGTALTIFSIKPFTLGSFIFSGQTNAIDTGDIVISKIDANANVIWTNAYGGNMQDGGGLQYLSSNNFYTLCASNSFGGNSLLVKTDTSGNLIWAKSISCPNSYSVNGQYETDKGVFTLTGKLVIPGTPNSSWDFLAMQIDTNGIVVNNKSYEFSPDDDYGLSFVKMNDKGYLFTLSEYNNSISTYDTKIFKTDSLFNSGCIPNTTLSFTTTDVTSLMHVNTLTMVASPLYIDVIDTVTFGSGRGCTIQTECNGFVGINEETPHESYLTMYPNPASDVLYFDYKLPETIAQATVNVYNYAGMLVQSFIIYGNEGTATQNVSGLSNGLYMFSIISNNTSIAQQKIIINK